MLEFSDKNFNLNFLPPNHSLGKTYSHKVSFMSRRQQLSGQQATPYKN